MQILLPCAKDMRAECNAHPTIETTPLFQDLAQDQALQMLEYTGNEIREMFKCNPQIATLNQWRYLHFNDNTPKLQAILSYTGMAYKRLKADNMTEEDYHFAQQHMWMLSFLYGLLRPMDMIRNYRMEGYIRLPGHGGLTQFEFWRPILTQTLIEAVKADDGVLINLASAEMRKMIDWEKVKAEVQVIDAEWLVWKNGKWKNIIIYTKGCRGGMTRHFIRERWQHPEQISSFLYDGFEYNTKLSTPNHIVFTIE